MHHEKFAYYDDANSRVELIIKSAASLFLQGPRDSQKVRREKKSFLAYFCAQFDWVCSCIVRDMDAWPTFGTSKEVALESRINYLTCL